MAKVIKISILITLVVCLAFFSFSVLSTNHEIVFAVIGDFGVRGGHASEVSQMISDWGSSHFIITTGDNSYLGPDSGGHDYQDAVGNYYSQYLNGRFWPSLGNHDYHSGPSQDYLDYFNLPGNERYYDVDYGLVHIFALDSETARNNVDDMEQQKAWLRSKLSSSDACYKVVYMHRPPYSDGEYSPGSTGFRWNEFANVDAVFSGHDHNYQHFEHNDVHYFVSGNGGHGNLYSFEASSRLNGNDHEWGAMRVTATSNSIKFESIVLGNRVIDTVIKNKDCTNQDTSIITSPILGSSSGSTTDSEVANLGSSVGGISNTGCSSDQRCKDLDTVWHRITSILGLGHLGQVWDSINSRWVTFSEYYQESAPPDAVSTPDYTGSSTVGTQNNQYDDIIDEAVSNFDFSNFNLGEYFNPVALIKALIERESSFNPTASSGSASGLMQIANWEDYADIRERYSLSSNVFDPRSNIFVGTSIIHSRLGRVSGCRAGFDRIKCAVAAYNLGRPVYDAIADDTGLSWVQVYGRLTPSIIYNSYSTRGLAWAEQRRSNMQDHVGDVFTFYLSNSLSNSGPRRSTEFIVLHDGTTLGYERTVNMGRWRQNGISSHYYISCDGTLDPIISENLIAHHAGCEVGRGCYLPGINDVSVGVDIENCIENINNEAGLYTEPQYATLNSLLTGLMATHNVPRDHIIAHFEVEARDDPRSSFDWSKLGLSNRRVPGNVFCCINPDQCSSQPSCS